MSGAHTAVEVVMTSLNWRTRDHRPAESALPGVEFEFVAEVAIVAEMATPLQVGQPVLVQHLGLEADSDQPGRSIPHLVVVVAAASVG